MTGTVYTCLHTNQSRSYLNHLVSNYVSPKNLKAEAEQVQLGCRVTEGNIYLHQSFYHVTIHYDVEIKS